MRHRDRSVAAVETGVEGILELPATERLAGLTSNLSVYTSDIPALD
jgi:hypothetical protein